ncbi:hypothetical protein [Polyangium aurulentum]|uniref:hypothetical protein n=1 Tax=Polyangium aurulentum TaxID=2567896 RepID=UPI0010AE78C9|nr:hypothetical protein [Polyangium aurulentum]UQA56468.1 hypothetical protein E8A73_034910 [Polyangium aurulentum]
MLTGRALALVVLAWSLVKVFFSRLFGRKTGLPLFHENYDADGLPSLDASERDMIASFSRCIACGRCDVGESERIARSGGQYPGLMSIVLASSRSMPDYDAAARSLAHVPDSVLAEKEKICPVDVPFVALARFVRAKAEARQAVVSGREVTETEEDERPVTPVLSP